MTNYQRSRPVDDDHIVGTVGTVERICLVAGITFDAFIFQTKPDFKKQVSRFSKASHEKELTLWALFQQLLSNNPKFRQYVQFRRRWQRCRLRLTRERAIRARNKASLGGWVPYYEADGAVYEIRIGEITSSPKGVWVRGRYRMPGCTDTTTCWTNAQKLYRPVGSVEVDFARKAFAEHRWWLANFQHRRLYQTRAVLG